VGGVHLSIVLLVRLRYVFVFVVVRNVTLVVVTAIHLLLLHVVLEIVPVLELLSVDC
jgi:hypothetical protein